MARELKPKSQSRKVCDSDDHGERECASLVLAALWNEQERMRAEIVALRAEIAALRETDVDGEPAPLGPNWVSLKEAAYLSGRSETGIRKLRDRGKVIAVHRGGRWHFDITSIKLKVRSRTLVRTPAASALSQNDNIQRQPLRRPSPSAEHIAQQSIRSPKNAAL